MADIGHFPFDARVPGGLVDSGRLSGDLAAFTDASDRLVRGVFDVGLRLHTLRVILAVPQAATAEIRSARAVVDETVDDLDRLVHGTGLAVLLIATRGTRPGRSGPRR
ncbi:hypothetical protein BJY24_004517 [Nocardia transvalensis]|uniref:Uncharacterized protein n=1 Tax=Nocardia transvalensis TaxID=37333 RepID=A0A7W9PGF3_9NOCA|nr:hypothetical protein [Nocardia transvalensis]MBB5915605.1 hypothetical protein [Nocardia transvalensis]